MEPKHKTFKPFDKVLVKYGKVWVVDFYRNFVESSNVHLTLTGTRYDDEILHYEGNEHLVGTTDEPEEVIELKEGEWIMVSDLIGGVKDMYVSTGRFQKIWGESFLVTYRSGVMDYKYAIRFSDFNPNDMEETRKHIICVKNGKVVKYKG